MFECCRIGKIRRQLRRELTTFISPSLANAQVSSSSTIHTPSSSLSRSGHRTCCKGRFEERKQNYRSEIQNNWVLNFLQIIRRGSAVIVHNADYLLYNNGRLRCGVTSAKTGSSYRYNTPASGKRHRNAANCGIEQCGFPRLPKTTGKVAQACYRWHLTPRTM